jgi:hypothetical protein
VDLVIEDLRIAMDDGSLSVTLNNRHINIMRMTQRGSEGLRIRAAHATRQAEGGDHYSSPIGGRTKYFVLPAGCRANNYIVIIIMLIMHGQYAIMYHGYLLDLQNYDLIGLFCQVVHTEII